jgi:hypothetical protein
MKNLDAQASKKKGAKKPKRPVCQMDRPIPAVKAIQKPMGPIAKVGSKRKAKMGLFALTCALLQTGYCAAQSPSPQTPSVRAAFAPEAVQQVIYVPVTIAPTSLAATSPDSTEATVETHQPGPLRRAIARMGDAISSVGDTKTVIRTKPVRASRAAASAPVVLRVQTLAVSAGATLPAAPLKSTARASAQSPAGALQFDDGVEPPTVPSK